MVTADRNDMCARQCVVKNWNIFPKNLKISLHHFLQYDKCTDRSKHLEEVSIKDFEKGLHVGQRALEYKALAKGIYETGQQLYTIGRSVAPMVALL